MDLNVVTDKYSAPPILAPQLLPGEELSTFADVMLQEVLENDQVQAAFKFTRFNNFKRGLYPALLHFEDPSCLA